MGDIFATPKLGESTPLNPLGVEAQSCPIPHEDFGSATVAGDKQEEIARERILIEVAFHHAEEAVEAFAHVGGLGVGKYSYRSGGTDHGRILRR